MFCRICWVNSAWLSIADASVAAGLTAADICILIDEGVLHSSQTIDGHLLVCEISIKERNSHLNERV
jgi:hypothetical protein